MASASGGGLALPFYDHNEHYGPLLIRSAPEHCSSALDIGCGEGRLARRIAAEAKCQVLGIDVDASMIEAARASGGDPRVRFEQGDFMSMIADGRFDFVVSVASIHHMPFAEALEKMASALAPGGVLAVLGLSRQTGLVDVAVAGVAVPVNAWYALRSAGVRSSAPVKPPEMSLRQIRTTARRILPGVRVQRLLLWRYLLTWTAPA